MFLILCYLLSPSPNVIYQSISLSHSSSRIIAFQTTANRHTVSRSTPNPRVTDPLWAWLDCYGLVRTIRSSNEDSDQNI